MERIFAWINRINSVLLLLALLGAAAVVVWLTWSKMQRDQITAVGSDAGKTLHFRLGDADRVIGTDTLLIRLFGNRSGKYSSRSDYYNEPRNVLFLSTKGNQADWLFEQHNNLLLNVLQLRLRSSRDREAHTKALYFTFVSTDTNEDGKLTSDDNFTIALSKADGSHATEILHNVARVLSLNMVDDRNLSLIYQLGNSVVFAQFTLDTFKKLSEEVITGLPQQL